MEDAGGILGLLTSHPQAEGMVMPQDAGMPPARCRTLSRRAGTDDDETHEDGTGGDARCAEERGPGLGVALGLMGIGAAAASFWWGLVFLLAL